MLNTQYMTNSTLVCPVKIEYVTKNDILGLKMMMKSGLEKIILKFLHGLLIKSTNSAIKMTWCANGGISKIFFLDHFSPSFLGQKYYFLSHIQF